MQENYRFTRFFENNMINIFQVLHHVLKCKYCEMWDLHYSMRNAEIVMQVRLNFAQPLLILNKEEDIPIAIKKHRHFFHIQPQ